MNCPVCDEKLRAVQKYGVEVDICPGCKGIWLDRGELEKILELEANGGPVTSREEIRPREAAPRYEEPRSRESAPRYQDAPRHRDHDDDDDRRRGYDQHGRPQQKRRESWLGDLLGSFGGGDD